MQKIFKSLLSIQVCAIATFNVVSCNTPKNPITDFQIGLDVDRSKAISNDNVTSKDKNNINSDVSNYYVVGDSLLDNGGLCKQLKNVYGLNLKLSGAYGCNNPYGESAFTDNVPASVELGRLIFKNKNYDTVAGAEGDKNQKDFGNNYAVGGATSNPDLFPFSFENEARTLVAQHKFIDNDLVFADMGGNDLFSIIDEHNPSKCEEDITKMLNGIKNSLLTMLNNGVKKLLYMTPPEMIDVPKYNLILENYKNENNTKDYDTLYNRLKAIDEETHTKIINLLDKIKKEYKNNFMTFDLYSYFDELVNNKGSVGENFWKENPNIINRGSYAFGKDLKLNKDISYDDDNHQVVMTIKPCPEAKDKNIDDFMFVDMVHPTYPVVKYVSKDIYNLLQKGGWIKDEKSTL